MVESLTTIQGYSKTNEFRCGAAVIAIRRMFLSWIPFSQSQVPFTGHYKEILSSSLYNISTRHESLKHAMNDSCLLDVRLLINEAFAVFSTICRTKRRFRYPNRLSTYATHRVIKNNSRHKSFVRILCSNFNHLSLRIVSIQFPAHLTHSSAKKKKNYLSNTMSDLISIG